MSTQNGSGKLYDSTFLIGGLRRKSEIKKLFNSTAREDFDALISALNQNHPDTGAILGGFKKLNSQTQADKVAWLWAGFAQTPRTDLAQILSKLGWPQSRKADNKTQRAVLAAANNKDTQLLQASQVFAKAIPANDETGNDEIYKAWLRTQDQGLEKIITDQKRHPSDPVLEALHALATGAMQRYQNLQDRDGLLLVKAYALAPPAFRDRIGRTVANSTDRDLKQAYRRAMSGEGLTNEQRISNLIAVNDHEGLFELSRNLLLSEVLVICEHWTKQPPQFEQTSQKAVCERAIKAYQTLGTFQIEAGPKLPDGLEDIFAYWRRQNPSDADLKNDLKDEDPFLQARGLYLGYERNLVDPAAVAAAANNDHWPLRMTARLLDPALMQKAANDTCCGCRPVRAMRHYLMQK